MTAPAKSCAVAFPMERNHATSEPIDATSPATSAQLVSLKALAKAVLKRNQMRNSYATRRENACNFQIEKDLSKLRSILEESSTEKLPAFKDNLRVDWLTPCPICSGHLFTESDRGGYFCCECQALPKGAKPLRIVQSAFKISRRQINCQAYEQTGVLTSTHPEHCREWHGAYCAGCALMANH